MLRRDGRIELVARSTGFPWPDTIAIGPDGDLHRSNAQLHLLPDFNGGEDTRAQPYKAFRLKLPQFGHAPRRPRPYSSQAHRYYAGGGPELHNTARVTSHLGD